MMILLKTKKATMQPKTMSIDMGDSMVAVRPNMAPMGAIVNLRPPLCAKDGSSTQ